MTREEMENFINAPLCMELYEKLKIIYDKGYQDCKKEIKGCKSIYISDSQKKLIEIYDEINASENAVCYLTSDDNDVIQSAIEALEQESCDDAISRQAVEEMIKAEMPERGMWEIEGDKEKETVCEVCVDLMQKLSALPSVNPQEPKTGHWKRDETIRLTYCSECGFGQHIDEYRTYNYCPNCGCRMFEPQERSEKK